MKDIKKDKGFTLVEVIVSTVILGILGTGIFAMASYSSRVSIRTQQKSIAISLVEKKINELVAGGVENLPSPPVPNEAVVISDMGALATSGTFVTTVQDTDPPDPKMKEVNVQLTWTDPFGSVRTESAATALYQG